MKVMTPKRITLVAAVGSVCATFAAIGFPVNVAPSSSDNLQTLRPKAEVTGKIIRLAPPNGRDAFPLISQALVEARLERKLSGKGSIILFGEGTYTLSKPILIDAADSGSAEAPLVLSAEPGAKVVISGAQPTSEVSPPAPLKKLIPSAVRSAVKFYELRDVMLPNPAYPRRASGSTTPEKSLTLLQGNRLLGRSRYPSRGYNQLVGLMPKSSPQVSPQIDLPANVAAAFKVEPQLWAGGYWTSNWAYEEVPVVSVDGVRLAAAQLSTRYPEFSGARFAIFNAFDQISKPGVFASAGSKVAVLPYPGSATVSAAILETVLRVDGARHVHFKGLAVQGSQGAVVSLKHAHDVTFSDGYLGMTGGNAVVLNGCSDVRIENSVITQTGGGGIWMADDQAGEGDPTTDTVISGVAFSQIGLQGPAYRPAVRLTGARNLVRDSKFGNLPHSAIIFSGDDHAIVENEIFRTNLETGDSGAVYAFNHLTSHGNRIVGNYFHDIVTPGDIYGEDHWKMIRAIYLDRWIGWVDIKDNLFDNVDVPVFVNSGNAVNVQGNIFFHIQRHPVWFYDIARHWSQNVGRSVYSEIRRSDPIVLKELGLRLGTAFTTDGRGRGGVIGGNFNYSAAQDLISPGLAPLQRIVSDRGNSTPQTDLTNFRDQLALAARDGANIASALRAAGHQKWWSSLKYYERLGSD